MNAYGSFGEGLHNLSNMSNTAEEIRAITNDYNSLIEKAAKEIRTLKRDKNSFQETAEQYMALNEDLVVQLTKAKIENKKILTANEELFKEAQRLNDQEEAWNEHKNILETEIQGLKEKIEAIETEFKSEVLRLREERESLLSRKENVSGENMQLIVEADSNAKLINSLKRENKEKNKSFEECNRLKQENEKLAVKIHQLADENKKLKGRIGGAKFKGETYIIEEDNKTIQCLRAELATIKADNLRLEENLRLSSDSPAAKEDRYETLIEQNRNLSLWREQLVEKNQTLSEENNSLKEKCQNLEDLLNEEETDISDVLELIKKMQQRNVSSPPATSNPISKFRDMKM